MTRADLLDTITPDEAVTAIQRHLNAGVIGFAGLYSRHQMDHANNWRELCVTISGISNERGMFDHYGVRRIRERMNELAVSVQSDLIVYAINMTFHGKETAFQDHRPQVAA